MKSWRSCHSHTQSSISFRITANLLTLDWSAWIDLPPQPLLVLISYNSLPPSLCLCHTGLLALSPRVFLPQDLCTDYSLCLEHASPMATWFALSLPPSLYFLTSFKSSFFSVRLFPSTLCKYRKSAISVSYPLLFFQLYSIHSSSKYKLSESRYFLLCSFLDPL